MGNGAENTCPCLRASANGKRTAENLPTAGPGAPRGHRQDLFCLWVPLPSVEPNYKQTSTSLDHFRPEKTTCPCMPCNGATAATFPSVPHGPRFTHKTLPRTEVGWRCPRAIPAVRGDYSPQHAPRPRPQTLPAPAGAVGSSAHVTAPNACGVRRRRGTRGRWDGPRLKSLRASRRGRCPVAQDTACRCREGLVRFSPGPGDSLSFNGRHPPFRRAGS